jgi:hypothetical protein
VGYVSPHRVLNQYVRFMSGFTPSDAEDEVKMEPEVDSRFYIYFNPFCFDSLKHGAFHTST